MAAAKSEAEASSKNDEKLQALEKEVAELKTKAADYDKLKASNEKFTAELADKIEQLANVTKEKDALQLELDEVKNDLEISQVRFQMSCINFTSANF